MSVPEVIGADVVAMEETPPAVAVAEVPTAAVAPAELAAAPAVVLRHELLVPGWITRGAA